MKQKELEEILEKHKKWLLNEDGGERANLAYTDLRYAVLQGADLRGAILKYADLQDADLAYTDLRDADLKSAVLRGAILKYAVLQDAVLRGADLRSAVLSCADLRGADLQYADLQDAILRDTDLKGVDLDYSCLPLWCGSLRAHFDDRQLRQIAYHLVRAGLHSKNAGPETTRELAKLIDFANEFHRVVECEKIIWEEKKS